MTKIVKLIAITTLFLSFAFPVVSEQIKEDKTDIDVLREQIKEDEGKIKVLEERIKGNSEKTDIQIEALKDELALRTESLEKRMNLYLGFAGLFILIITVVGFTTITKWIQKTIEEKTDEEIKNYLTKEYIEGLIRDKGEEAIETLVSELEVKGKETLAGLEDLKTEYENSINSLKNKEININIPLPENTVKNLEKFAEKLVQTKTEATYSFDDWLYKGMAKYEKEEYDKAITSWTKAIELDPKNARAYYNRGIAYGNLKQYEREMEDYNKAIELDPKYVLAYNNRGSAYGRFKEHEKAIENFNKAIELDPKYVLAYNNRGIAYGNLKQYERAIEDCNKAIELDPKNANTHENLSEFKIITGDYNSALNSITKALSLSSEIEDKEAVCLYLKCIAVKLLNMDTSEAEAELNEILKKDFTLTWSFDEIESWLKDADILDDAKRFITEKTELLKSKIAP